MIRMRRHLKDEEKTLDFESFFSDYLRAAKFPKGERSEDNFSIRTQMKRNLT